MTAEGASKQSATKPLHNKNPIGKSFNFKSNMYSTTLRKEATTHPFSFLHKSQNKKL